MQCKRACPLYPHNSDRESGFPAIGHVRFAPESGHVRCSQGCPLWAKSGHRRYSLLRPLCTKNKHPPASVSGTVQSSGISVGGVTDLRLGKSAQQEDEMSSAIRPIVTRKGSENTLTAQSGGAIRISGVSPQHTPATKIWFGKVSNEPGFRSLPHHHGEAETGGYVFKGKGRIYWGENYSEFIDMTEGDFVFVPPHLPHIEVNMSTTEELIWLTCRTPDNIVVNLPDIEDSVLIDYRHR
jgi:uncharacterized RmlC-like cupin family protein